MPTAISTEAELDRDAFLVFQPQTRPDGTVVAYEALIRWRGDMLGTARRIWLAERNRMIHSLGRWVLRNALASAPGPVAVNVSPAQLRASFPSQVEEILAEVGAPSSALLLEVIESRPVDDAGRSVLQEMRGLGVRVSLDDVGTGYATEASVSSLPLDQVKLDRSLLRDPSPCLEWLAHTAQVRGLEVVVEGIETEADRERAVGAGADLLQGFFIGKPAPVLRAA